MDFKPVKLCDCNNDLSKDWYVFYSFKHPETNKYVRFRHWISNKIKTKYGRREKAHEMIRELNAKLSQGWSPFNYAESRLTSVTDAFYFALNLKNIAIGKRAQQTYKSIAGMFLKYLESRKISEINISEVHYRVIQDFFDHSIMKEKISARTYNNRITALKTIFNFLKKRDYINYNPMDKIERMPEVDAEEKRTGNHTGSTY